MTSHTMQPPKAVGLYDPRFEHDACGVGMVARLDNEPTHEVVERAIAALENLEHRGASGADPHTGDGAGILMQMPDELLRAVVEFELPPAGSYGVLMCFLPTEDAARGRASRSCSSEPCASEGQRVLGWRDVPVDPEHTGEVAGACRPVIRQLFVGAGPEHAERPGRVRAQAVRDPARLRADSRTEPACTSRRAPRARSTTRAC